MSKTKHNHLVSNVPNTEENRAVIKKVNKMSRKSESVWKLYIRYRKPKEGHAYGWGGSLKRDNANAFSVYIQDRRPYGEIPTNQYNNRLWDKNRELEKENEALKKKLAIYSNPYIDFSVSELENAIMDIRSDVADEVLLGEEKPNFQYLLASHIERYNLLMEALKYAEKHD